MFFFSFPFLCLANIFKGYDTKSQEQGKDEPRNLDDEVWKTSDTPMSEDQVFVMATPEHGPNFVVSIWKTH